ncbi:hypothetical protein FMM05_14380 [Flavobacterium zepuense]|uniref:Lipocalin-like domain-containing protein n=1 Tax=Flavobacterium zepuense TaxID=2593302 RepID=A0A552UYQ9_9FLAO|nr:lipocalin family protein [Flavobacterium zepuense]TRW23376.1 hypothetical protein FMM05_14380 [Flavobacterium zepuense]
MKRINLLAGALFVAALGFTACSDDDNDKTDVTIAGTYELEEVNTEAATDFNLNGTPHIDQTEESNCYDAGKIVLREDSTFTYTITGILVDASTGSSGCLSSVNVSGTWEADGTGNNAVISAAYEDQNGDDQIITLTKSGDKLTLVDDNILSRYPDRNDAGGATYTSGSITYVFEK